MKRIISLILSLGMLITSLGTAYAEQTKRDTLSDEAIKNYVISRGIWKGGSFEDNRAVTRGEFAGMIGRAIGVAETGTVSGFEDVDVNDINFKEISALTSLKIINGSNGIYRPNDTITREETAVIVERIYKSIFEEFDYDTEYRETRFLDFDQISDWAVQSIVNVCDAGIMLARVGRYFAPKENTTLMEAAELAYKMSNTENKSYIYSVSDPTGDPTTEYSVYQKAKITPQGLAGFGMVARFSGAPGDIYVSRTTTKPEYEHAWGNPADPVAFARVIDPDGNAVARVDLNYIESGKMAKVITIPEGKGGIWQIQIVNGRRDDVVEIGLKNPSSWGIRGEPSFSITETTPKELYFWVPTKFKQANFGSSHSFSIKDAENATVGLPTAVNRGYAKYDITSSTLKPETAYKVVYPEGTVDAVLAIMGVPKVLSPTKEMAEDLKGNYSYTESGLQMHGPLQKRAREAAEEIYEKRQGDFSVSIDKSEEIPELQNVIGEGYVMSQSGIAAVNNTLINQCLALDNPYLGAMVGKAKTSGETAYPTDTWEVDYYSAHFNGTEFTSAISLNAQLNYYYGNQALIDRATMYMLSAIYMCNDMMTMDDTTPSARAGHNYAYTHSNFYLEYINTYFYHLKDFIDPKYRAIIQEGIEIMTDKMMNFRGNGPSNQYTHSVISAMYAYLSTGEERYHRYFKRGVRIAYGINEGWAGIGQAPAGYCIENGGCDGNYYQMNVNFMSHFHADYCSSPMADPETVEIIKGAINKTLKFESMFHGHKVSGLTTGSPKHFTSRTDSTVDNRGGHVGYSATIDEYPLARAMWDYEAQSIWGTLFPWFINSEESAKENVEEVWEKYGNYYDNSTRKSTAVPMYDIFDGRGLAEAAVLPVNQGEAINEVPGVISVTHKGLYLLSFYNSSLPNGSIGSMCYYGGPSLITSENTSGIVQSLRHKDAKTSDGVVASSIYGTNPDGSFYVSGKEVLELEWLEEGKKFRTYGTGVGNSRKLAWTYELTDDGIIMTPSIGAISAGQEFWVNIPVTDQTAEGFKFTDEAGKLVMEYNGANTVMEWDSSLEYKFLEADGGVRKLRIKLPASGEVSIKITTQK